MSEYDGFKERPSLSEAPDECRFNGCDVRPKYYVKFIKPKEYVCYCTDHAEQVYRYNYARVKHLLS